jgi:hypothetical protein
MQPVEVGVWTTLPSEGASALAIGGGRLAAASPAHLVVWQGTRRVVGLDAVSAAPGVPRLAGDRVYWGPAVVDLSTGAATPRAGAVPDYLPQGRGDQAAVYAWSPDGARILAGYQSGGGGKIVLHDGGSGAPLGMVWSGAGMAPRVAWMGRTAGVAGFNEPQVFGADGTPRATIPLGGAAIGAIDATADDRRLVIVDINRSMALVDGASFAILDRWSGRWAHGAIAPDGSFVAALDTAGNLQFACLEADRFVPIGDASGDPHAGAVAVGDGKIAISGGGELRVATVAVRCPQRP